jgi:GntR family transcriptional regulator
VKAALISRIESLDPGASLPTYEQLAAAMHCSVAPIKQAMQELRREGRVDLQRGRPAKVLWNSFSHSALAAGGQLDTQAVQTAYRRLEQGEQAIGQELGLEPEAPCLVCERVRYVDGHAVAIQLAYINPRFFPEPRRFFLDHDVTSGSLSDVYAGLGVRPLNVTAVLKVGAADERERQLLSLPEGTPVLRAHQRTVVDLEGHATTLEVMDATYTQDIEYTVERLPRLDTLESIHG